jgi:hypothetical protein
VPQDDAMLARKGEEELNGFGALKVKRMVSSVVDYRKVILSTRHEVSLQCHCDDFVQIVRKKFIFKNIY